jgi:hypothetical protein
MLPKPFFVRVERSLIIDLEAVRRVIAQDRDEVSVEVEGFNEPLKYNDPRPHRVMCYRTSSEYAGIGSR